MVYGYMGKLLIVDLSNKKLMEEPLEEKFCRDYLGGYGIGSRVIITRQKAGADPLGQDSMIGILSGALSGTGALTGTKFTVVGKSPLTGGWGDANSGGYFGAYLKYAGFDGVFFTGISDKPVFLYIRNGKAELRNADHIWGKDVYQTEDILKSELGKNIQIVSIGPAGELCSKIACVMHNKGNAAARFGLGAVMGSKKLKAVVVDGELKVPVFNEDLVNELRKKYTGLLGGHISWLREWGTPFLVVPGVQSGDSPVKNWAGVGLRDFAGYEMIADKHVKEKQIRPVGCYRCPVVCEALMQEGTGEYKWEAGLYRPEYETMALFGTNLLNSNLDSILKLNDICNRYGIDTISAAGTMAFAIECFENGIIGKSDTDGIELTWGNHSAIVKMTENIALRRGFGEVLADGTNEAVKRIGKGAEKFAINIAGHELPAHDPKQGYHYLTTYITDAAWGCHFKGSEEMHPEGLVPKFERSSFSGRGQAHRRGANFTHAVVSAGWCLFVYWAYPSVTPVPEFINAVTGWDVDIDELVKTGERIANVRQVFNVRENINLRKFNIPDRVIGNPPFNEGPLAGVKIEVEPLVREYLEAMDWDVETAKPSKAKLTELGLNDLINMVYP